MHFNSVSRAVPQHVLFMTLRYDHAKQSEVHVQETGPLNHSARVSDMYFLDIKYLICKIIITSFRYVIDLSNLAR